MHADPPHWEAESSKPIGEVKPSGNSVRLPPPTARLVNLINAGGRCGTLLLGGVRPRRERLGELANDWACFP
jgi:hypothetical protein